MMYATGSRAARRASSASNAAGTGRSSTYSCARSTPSACASSSSASSLGVSQPALSSRADAVSSNRPFLEPTALLIVLERGRELVKLAHQDLIEVVQQQVHAV